MKKSKSNKTNGSLAASTQVQDILRRVLKHIGGSDSEHWNSTLVDQVLKASWIGDLNAQEQQQLMIANIASLGGIAPKDELEGMMAAQLIASHNAAMECYRRAMITNQSFEGRIENLNQANKLSRTWAALLNALNNHRGKGQQKVTVEHVHVHSGGQAVVGNVERPGGEGPVKLEEQPHAKQITNAPEPSMWRADAERNGLPSARDGERPVPYARRKVSRRANRE